MTNRVQINREDRVLTVFRKATGQEHGVISVAYAMAIVLMLFVLANVLLSTVGGDLRSSSNRLLQSRVFYAAESGLEMALKDLDEQGDGVLSGLNINGVQVSTTVVDDSVLESTASASGMTRTLRLRFRRSDCFPEAFHYALSTFSSGDQIIFQGSHERYLDGKVFTYSQQGVVLESGLQIGEVTIVLPEGVFVENLTGYPVGVSHFSSGTTPVEWPELNTDYYENYFNNVNGYPDYTRRRMCMRWGGTISSDLNLSVFTDSVLYYHSSLIIQGCTITGPGVITTPGNITIRSNAVIGPDVRIIAGGTVNIQSGAQITGSGSIVYGDQEVEVSGAYTAVAGSMLSPGEVEISGDTDPDKRGSMVGIIYAGTEASIKHTKVFGSIVTQSLDDDEIRCAYLTYGSQYLPPALPPGFVPASPGIHVVSGSWEEE